MRVREGISAFMHVLIRTECPHSYVYTAQKQKRWEGARLVSSVRVSEKLGAQRLCAGVSLPTCVCVCSCVCEWVRAACVWCRNIMCDRGFVDRTRMAQHTHKRVRARAHTHTHTQGNGSLPIQFWDETFALSPRTFGRTHQVFFLIIIL